ncbi:MAG: hypothetical protein ACRDT6_20420, partial [Micromonosporaceae bacterium]
VLAFAAGAGRLGGGLGGFALLALGLGVHTAYQRGTLLRQIAHSNPDVPAIAYATADALHAAGLIDQGAQAFTMAPDGSGAWQFHLTGADAASSATYATALDEVLSAPADPRYLIGRYVLDAPGPGWWRTLWAGNRFPRRENAVIYHALPSVLGEHRRRADAYRKTWRRWVSDWDAPIYTRNPEGSLLLASRRGLSPLDVHTSLRLTWE